ncbi:unnamed protein product [Prorocentrum cordatum]|uniref:Uncharacterized protein n=1 Tax=Prorocentrum cordatum TaxID=2364126 RepID=A0ABN9QEM1_9DINO|nr:unnamed protein product [Polarella glacialis]
MLLNVLAEEKHTSERCQEAATPRGALLLCPLCARGRHRTQQHLRGRRRQRPREQEEEEEEEGGAGARAPGAGDAAGVDVRTARPLASAAEASPVPGPTPSAAPLLGAGAAAGARRPRATRAPAAPPALLLLARREVRNGARLRSGMFSCRQALGPKFKISKRCTNIT